MVCQVCKRVIRNGCSFTIQVRFRDVAGESHIISTPSLCFDCAIETHVCLSTYIPKEPEAPKDIPCVT